MRGEIYRLPAPKDQRGHEQAGRRFAVVVNADEFETLSTWLICPTSASASAPARTWRPEVEINSEPTRVLVEQMRTVDPTRLGPHVGFLTLSEMQEIDKALKLVLGLR